MNKNVSDQLVETLVDAGIQRIYALTGDSLNHVNAAVHRNGKIKWIHVRHEETAAYAAGAEAQLNGLACCAGSSGPGHVHLINGLYDSHRSSASVLAIASTIPTGEFGTGFFQETNTVKLFDDCSCYNQIADTPAQLPRMLQAALQHAVHKRGVAVIGLPGDITDLPAVEAETTTMLFRNQPVVRPSEDELLQLAELLNSHKKITIFCGLGAAEAHKEVIQLAEKLKTPVAYSYKAKMAIQYKLPIKIIVFNNRSLGMVKLEMQVAGIPDLETDMLNPDFIKIAEAMGMPGIGINNPDEVKPGLEKAFLQEGPVLVSIQTDPNALAMPPRLEFDQMKGFALYMGKMMLSGRMDEAFKIISSNYKHLGEVI